MKMIGAIFAGDVRNLFRNVIAAIVVAGLVLVPPLYAWFTTLGFRSEERRVGKEC